MSSQSSHHPLEVLLAQFSLYVHKGGLKPDSFHFRLSCIHTSQIILLNCRLELELCGGQTPRHAVQVLSMNTTVGYFGIDSRGSVKDSGRTAALIVPRSKHWMAWCSAPASQQQAVSASLNPVFNLYSANENDSS